MAGRLKYKSRHASEQKWLKPRVIGSKVVGSKGGWKQRRLEVRVVGSKSGWK